MGIVEDSAKTKLEELIQKRSSERDQRIEDMEKDEDKLLKRVKEAGPPGWKEPYAVKEGMNKAQIRAAATGASILAKEILSEINTAEEEADNEEKAVTTAKKSCADLELSKNSVKRKRQQRQNAPALKKTKLVEVKSK